MRPPDRDPQIIAEVLGVPLRTAQRWVALGRMPRDSERLFKLRTEGDLGVVFPGWAGSRLRPDCIFPEGSGRGVTLAELRALPFLLAAVADLRRELAQYRAAGAPKLLPQDASQLERLDPSSQNELPLLPDE